jgi:hypothetical protein
MPAHPARALSWTTNPSILKDLFMKKKRNTYRIKGIKKWGK